MATAAARGPGGMTGVALHLLVAVGAVRGWDVLPPVLAARIRAHELRPGRLVVVVGMPFRDRVLHQAHFPLELGVQKAPLDQLALHPLEARLAVGIPQQAQIVAPGGRRGTGGA